MIPEITGNDRTKVELANQLYDQLTEFFLHALAHEILCVIENPQNSLYWSTSFFRRLHEAFPGSWTSFDNCCHGGDRPKRTSLWCSTNGVLHHLQVFCDNSHPHKPWIPRVTGKSLRFVTKEEAAYPALLAPRIVHALMAFRQQVPVIDETLHEQIAGPRQASASRIALGVQPKGNKLKPLVAEFGHYVSTVSPARDKIQVEKFLAALPRAAALHHVGFVSGVPCSPQ